MTSDVKIARARGQAEAARARLMATLEEIKLRLSPQKVTSDVVQGAKNKSLEVADQTVTAVKERPVVVAGIAAATALFLARKPLIAAVAGWFDDEADETPKASSRRRRNGED